MDSGRRLTFGEFVLDIDALALLRDGEPVELRPKAFDTLRYLAERPGRVVTKDELVAAVWPGIFVNDDALAQCVRDIRKALGDASQSLLRTVPRRGYMLAVETGPVVHRPAGLSSAGSPAVRLAALALLLVAIGVTAWALWPSVAQPPSAFMRDPRLAIVVLPFDAASEADADAWLGDGLAEDVMTALSRFSDLAVIARNSSFRYGQGQLDLARLREDLHADFLLQGSVRRSGERLRLAVQLVDLSTGVNRWADHVDGALADVFAIQDSIAGQIAARLALEARDAAASRLQGVPPHSMAVYELALRGRQAFASFTRDGTVEALDLADRALAAEPGYAVAWDLRARALVQFFIQPYDERRGDPAMLSAALEAATRAVELDPGYSTAVATLGSLLVRAGDFDGSLGLLREAIRLNPNDSVAIASYADITARAGNHRDSLDAWQAFARLDPIGGPLADALRARSSVLVGELEGALAYARRCAATAPGFQPCLVFLAISEQALGNEAAAREAIERLLIVSPQFTADGHFRIVTYRNQAEADALIGYLKAAGAP